MAITYTDWNTCDWQGGYTLDWSSPSAIRSRLLVPYCEALRQAIVEREHHVTISKTAAEFAFLAQPVDDLSNTPTLDNWPQTFRDILNKLILKYVDYFDHAGDWHLVDVGEISPAWTLLTILAHTTDPIRVPVGGFPFAEWAFQQYELLNLLRWSYNYGAAVDPYQKRLNVAAHPTDWQQAVDDAVINWQGTPWTNGPLFEGSPNGKTSVDWRISQSDYRGQAERQRAAFGIAASPLPPTAQYTMDIYVYTTAPAADVTIFDGESFGFQEDKWFLWETLPLQIAAGALSSIVGDVEDDPPVYPPTPDLSGDIFSRGWQIGKRYPSAHGVAKWQYKFRTW